MASYLSCCIRPSYREAEIIYRVVIALTISLFDALAAA